MTRGATPLAAGVLLFALSAGACRSGPEVRRGEALDGLTVQIDDKTVVLTETAVEARRIPLDFTGCRGLHLDGFDGDVRVVASGGQRPELVAHLRTVASSHAKAQKRLEEVRVRQGREDGWLAIRIERPPLSDLYVTSSSYDLVVPAGLDVRIAAAGDVEVEGPVGMASIGTTYGDVTLVGAEGNILLESTSGSLTLRDARGERIKLRTSHGDVHVSDARATEIDAASGAGDVTLARTTAVTTSVATSHGTLRLTDAIGDLVVDTPLGGLRLRADEGSFADLEGGHGTVRLAGGSGELVVNASQGRIDVVDFAGAARVESRYGNVALAGVFTLVRASSGSGRVAVDAEPGSVVEQPWRLRSGYGNVSLSVAPDFSCRLEARTRNGSIRSSFAHAIEATASTDDTEGIRSVLGQGGERVVLESTSGRIEIRRRDG